jgi:hypothetical protein
MLESFPFLGARAELIARQSPELITAAGIDADDFRAKMKAVRKVRNVTEHWSDLKRSRARTMHDHVTRTGNLSVWMKCRSFITTMIRSTEGH